MLEDNAPGLLTTIGFRSTAATAALNAPAAAFSTDKRRSSSASEPRGVRSIGRPKAPNQDKRRNGHGTRLSWRRLRIARRDRSRSRRRPRMGERIGKAGSKTGASAIASAEHVRAMIAAAADQRSRPRARPAVKRSDSGHRRFRRATRGFSATRTTIIAAGATAT